MLPLKWKIFKIINSLYLASCLGILGFSCYNISLRVMSYGPMEVLIFSLFLLCFLVFSANCIYNLYMLEKLYPDNYNKRPKKLSRIFLTLNLIILSLLFLFFLYGLSEELRNLNKRRHNDNIGIWILLVLFILISFGVYITWLQIILRKTIRRNFESSMDNFLKT
jgi:hypothetical protein